MKRGPDFSENIFRRTLALTLMVGLFACTTGETKPDTPNTQKNNPASASSTLEFSDLPSVAKHIEEHGGVWVHLGIAAIESGDNKYVVMPIALDKDGGFTCDQPGTFDYHAEQYGTIEGGETQTYDMDPTQSDSIAEWASVGSSPRAGRKCVASEVAIVTDSGVNIYIDDSGEAVATIATTAPRSETSITELAEVVLVPAA